MSIERKIINYKRIWLLAFRSAEHSSELSHFAPLLGFVAGRDRVFDAVRDMVGEDFLLRPSKRGSNSRNLRNDVDAIAVILNHAGEAPDLAFDPLQPLHHRCLGSRLHAAYIPP